MKRQKILIIGWDGYIGFPLTLRCLHKGHIVHGIDNYSRRDNVDLMGSISATDILKPKDREADIGFIGNFTAHKADVVKSRDHIAKLVARHKYSTIINLAHNPSAPFSMIDRYRANEVLTNNVIGTNELLWTIKENSPDSHYITIGSTGEYNHGINVDIAEGYFEFERNGRTSVKSLFPRQGNSIYHCSKIASTYLIDYLAKIWKLRCTDVMQSIVYGLWTPELVKYKQVNRCDTDESFGTVINRFVVQALLGQPLTIFGHGKHQRAFLSLNDSVQALEIAINNPAEPGVVQTWNQLSDWHSILNIAEMVQSVIPDTEVTHIDSPRKEHTDSHYYGFDTDILTSLGYEPTRTIKQEIEYMASVIRMNPKKRAKLESVIYPKVKFNV